MHANKLFFFILCVYMLTSKTNRIGDKTFSIYYVLPEKKRTGQNNKQK